MTNWKTGLTPQNDVFESIVFQTESKFKYSKACPDARTDSIKSALDLLVLAGLAYRIPHSDARGFPLGAQTNPKRFKTVLLDVGLHQQRLGLDLTPMLVTEDFHIDIVPLYALVNHINSEV